MIYPMVGAEIIPIYIDENLKHFSTPRRRRARSMDFGRKQMSILGTAYKRFRLTAMMVNNLADNFGGTVANCVRVVIALSECDVCKSTYLRRLDLDLLSLI